MIQYFLDEDWGSIQTNAYIILIFWVMMIFAVLIDLWTGVEKAIAKGEKPHSSKFRRTITKIGEYWRVLAMALIIDIIASILPFYKYPYASVVCSIAVVIIELKSVIENLREKKSNAAKILDMAAEVMKATNIEQAQEVVRKITNEYNKDEK